MYTFTTNTNFWKWFMKISRSIIITLFKQTYFKTDLKKRKRKTCIYYLSKAHTDYCASPFKIWTRFISWSQKPHNVIIESAQSELPSLVQLCKPQSSHLRVLYTVSNQCKSAKWRNYQIRYLQDRIVHYSVLTSLSCRAQTLMFSDEVKEPNLSNLIKQHRKKTKQNTTFSHSG